MKPKNAIFLTTAALVWGIAFVAQSSASEILGTFTFNGLRSFLAAFALLPLIYHRRKDIQKLHKISRKQYAKSPVFPYIGGLACGFCLLLGSSLQQAGIAKTTVGKAGFITALYIIFVPIASIIIFHKKITLPVISSAILGMLGLYLLCMKESLKLGTGDTLVFLCAIAFTAHILVIDYFNQYIDGVVLSCIQFFVVGVISLPVILIIERPSINNIVAAAIPILYAGLLSSGVGYTLQIVGQKDMNPTIASLILSLESVFSAIAGWILLGQKLSVRELWGCAIMFVAILIATAGDALLAKWKKK